MDRGFFLRILENFSNRTLWAESWNARFRLLGEIHWVTRPCFTRFSRDTIYIHRLRNERLRFSMWKARPAGNYVGTTRGDSVLSLSLMGQRVAFPISNSMEEASGMMYDSEKNRRELITIIRKRHPSFICIRMRCRFETVRETRRIFFFFFFFPIDLILPGNIVTREINAFLMLKEGRKRPWRKHTLGWILHRLV